MGKVSAVKQVSRMELAERRKELNQLKTQIKGTPSGSQKDKLLKDAAKLAQEVELLKSTAK